MQRSISAKELFTRRECKGAFLMLLFLRPQQRYPLGPCSTLTLRLVHTAVALKAAEQCRRVKPVSTLPRRACEVSLYQQSRGFGSLATLAQQGWKGALRNTLLQCQVEKPSCLCASSSFVWRLLNSFLGRDRDGRDSKGWAHGQDANPALESFVTALVCPPGSQLVSTAVLVPITLIP